MIYENFKLTKNYTPELEQCIEHTVEMLLNNPTDVREPGMLLGNIQSGKTRSFIGILGLAFDKGYDVAVIFTKGTRALARQTLRRLDDEFKHQIDKDLVKVYDILNVPDLSPWLLRQKLIIVVKKETNNLDRLNKLFMSYEEFNSKRILFIDDEADFASNGFKRNREAQDGISINTLSEKMSDIRKIFGNRYDYLQVTATPYNLYLQPQEIILNGEIHEPIRPRFTSLVPIHEKYVGGKTYFEDSELTNHPAHFIHVPVPINELDALGRSHATVLRNVLQTDRLTVLRDAIITYFIAGAIRKLESGVEYKSSFLFHTEISKGKHNWQMELITEFLNKLKLEASDNTPYFQEIVRTNFLKLKESAKLVRSTLPPFPDIQAHVKNYITKGFYGVIKVNSDNDIENILGSNGQLRLDNPYNIFVGGYTLDRGITIANLLGFYYGRNPRVFQQDTVLQHSRMYGARSLEDVSLTRLYTTQRIYNAMSRMHHLDSITRAAFERGEHNDGVVFIERDRMNEIRPCSPNKILISEIETVRPGKRFLPYGFNTKSKIATKAVRRNLDKIIDDIKVDEEGRGIIEAETAKKIILLINSTLSFEDGHSWDTKTLSALIKRFSSRTRTSTNRGMVNILIRRNRNLSQMKSNGAFQDAPDDGNTDTQIARAMANDTCTLILLQQNGDKNKGWKGTPFWWPVLIAPSTSEPAIVATNND